MKIKKSNLISVILCAFFLALNLGLAHSEDEAKTGDDNATKAATLVVEGLHQRLIESMKMGKAGKGCIERYKFLEDYVSSAFDFPTICRIVLGRRHWKDIDSEKKMAFINTFSRMTVATYALRFDSYSGQSFKTKGAIMNKRGHVLVDASLVKKDGQEIDFKYLLRNTKKGWKIVSVSAKGVNDLSVKRADYNAFLKGHSIDELIKKLDEKAKKCH